ncbi:MAG: carboxylating nicotinate-nucleotide diphosphorylase [Methylotenera sp.]|nr:carboxylating nicotinate-nucleotide diphosphorylase [Oligoflexia bacterium]
MNTALIPQLQNYLLQGLNDDGWEMDWTTLGVAKAGGKKGIRKIKAKIIAKSSGVWVGEGLSQALELLSNEMGSPIRVKSLKTDGTFLKPGVTVCQWEGSPQAILALERPFLNVVSYLGGIATRTRGLVDQVEKAWPRNEKSALPRVTSTRKTLPHYRDIAVYAVMCGGGFAHRVSLSGGVLIKENHIAAAGGIAQALAGVRSVAPHGLKLEIEVRNLKELSKALKSGADAVLLDNFTPAEVKEALILIQHSSASEVAKPVVEVSGGLNESSIASYAIPGVHVLSVGSLTHSVQSIDLSLLVTE